MDLVIFGNKETASLANFYLKDSYNIVAFCVDSEYLDGTSFENKPLLALEEIKQHFPPPAMFFCPIADNKIRTERYLKIKFELGYKLASYLNPRATYYGSGIGDNCFILEDNTIQPFVTIGNNNIIWSGNHIGHHSRIGDNCFISSHVVISGKCILEDSVWIGVNSTLKDKIVIARNTLIGAGSLVLNSTEENGVYYGSPAQLQRYSCKI